MKFTPKTPYISRRLTLFAVGALAAAFLWPAACPLYFADAQFNVPLGASAGDSLANTGNNNLDGVNGGTDGLIKTGDTIGNAGATRGDLSAPCTGAASNIAFIDQLGPGCSKQAPSPPLPPPSPARAPPLPPPPSKLLMTAVGAGFSEQLYQGLSKQVAETLGLDLTSGLVKTVGGDTVNVTDTLFRSVAQCSGRLCINLETYAGVSARVNLADINAQVLLWRPKVAGTFAGNKYDPSTKDWASVVAACRALFKHEKRFASFFIRSAFHDSMAVDVNACPGPDCGGADSSLLLTIDEMVRPENINDNFALVTSRAAKKIASFYDISVADTLAVCAAVAPEVLSNGRLRILPADGTPVLPVGRLDSIKPAPPGQLPTTDAGVQHFVDFWHRHGFTAREAMALMGSHALVDAQGCLRGARDVCDPSREDCSNVRMFRWENHYFKDLCSPTLRVTVQADTGDPPEPADTPIKGMTEPEFDAEARLESCLFTSNEGKAMALNELRLVQAGQLPEQADLFDGVFVDWSNRNCTGGAAFGLPASSCPHAAMWPYTSNDAFLGQACQGFGGNSTAFTSVRAAAREFLSQPSWDSAYRSAYVKMVSKFATFSPAAKANPLNISGDECPSDFHLEAACAQGAAGPASKDTSDLYSGLYEPVSCPSCTQRTCSRAQCSLCVSLFNQLLRKLSSVTSRVPLSASSCCACSTIVREYRYQADKQQVVHLPFISRYPDLSPSAINPAQPLPAVDNLPVPVRVPDPTPIDDSIVPTITSNGVFSDPPLTPYHVARGKVCPSVHGVSVRVQGFPSSPFKWTPFTLPFSKPPKAQRANSYCKNGTNLCLDAYEMDVIAVKANLTCPKGLTWILTYNGTTPGPTIRAVVGRQTLVRFNNRLTASALTGTPFSAYTPCDTTPGRQGRPISVHLHGSASLAPYDGWAEDTTCGGESKDYYYPNSRSAFGWYHDHQLEITAENAYFGLSGLYIMHDLSWEGGCGEPWNLNALPDTEMQFKDAVLDGNCELYYDRSGPHRNNLYGDVNMVNGIPWPVMTIVPRWQRFRWLNAAVTRPFKLRMVDSVGADVSGRICKVIAGDGGLRRTPSPFPPAGLFMGVAERYEVVCDFSGLAGRTLYLWNAKDERRMKDVPFFCQSHLVMKINVAAACQPSTSASSTTGKATAGTACMTAVAGFSAAFNGQNPSRTALDAVLKPQTDIPLALEMAKKKQCTRTFRFGRRHGHWTINGETWHTSKVAASNVGHNTWEVWCLETGGSWFHPIHIHLVDFYVLTRNHDEALVHDYERWTPKDVVQLDPSSHIALLVRFGPHRGQYMFHCHNLVHEDHEMMRALHVIAAAGRMNYTMLPMQSHPTLIQNLNVIYDLYDDPVHPNFGPRPTSSLVPLHTLPGSGSATTPLSYSINNGLYRIFYPGGATGESSLLYSWIINPWLVSLPNRSRCMLTA